MLRQSLKKELPQEMTSASYVKTLKIPTDLKVLILVSLVLAIPFPSVVIREKKLIPSS